MTILYGKNKNNQILVWQCYAEKDNIIVKHGKRSGKITSKVTKATPKNVGKTNETSASEQALIEVAAKITKQRKRGYFDTEQEALDHVTQMPMLLHNHNKFADRIKYPCIVQAKLNGLRMLTTNEGLFLSKSGEIVDHYVPTRIRNCVNALLEHFKGKFGLDGEIYSPELSLQQINSAFKKHNDNTPKLKYVLYDVVIEKRFFQNRYQALQTIMNWLRDESIDVIQVNAGQLVESPDEGDVIYNTIIDNDGEGVVYRNLNGLYEPGGRSYDAIKRKHRQTMEAKVLFAVEDKNQQAVLTCETETGKLFECLMLKNADPYVNYRLFCNSNKLMDKFIEIEYEELSDAGVPTKPVGQRIRNVKVTSDGCWIVED